MRVPSSLFLGLATSLILLGACQANPGTGPRPTGPGTSNQVITLQADTLTAELSGASETPAVASQAHGYGIFQLNQAKDTLIARVYVAGLSGPITGAHLHLGLAGKSGEVVEPLAVTGNVLTGTWKRSDAEQPLSEARVKSLLNGELYVNVHTEKFPGGEIRGQLTPSSDTIYPVHLIGSESVPPLDTTASGVAWVRVKADRSELSLKGWTYGLSGPANAAHLHKGAKGSTGEVLKDVEISGTSLNLSWKQSDSPAPLTPGVLDLLSKGELYLNVHTTKNPNGEIRGQIQPLASLPAGPSAPHRPNTGGY